MFLGTSRGPGGVAADGEADALHSWTGFELFSRAEWIITAANEARNASGGRPRSAGSGGWRDRDRTAKSDPSHQS
jgi:hypothetical protein